MVKPYIKRRYASTDIKTFFLLSKQLITNKILIILLILGIKFHRKTKQIVIK